MRVSRHSGSCSHRVSLRYIPKTNGGTSIHPHAPHTYHKHTHTTHTHTHIHMPHANAHLHHTQHTQCRECAGELAHDGAQGDETPTTHMCAPSKWGPEMSGTRTSTNSSKTTVIVEGTCTVSTVSRLCSKHLAQINHPPHSSLRSGGLSHPISQVGACCPRPHRRAGGCPSPLTQSPRSHKLPPECAAHLFSSRALPEPSSAAGAAT